MARFKTRKLTSEHQALADRIHAVRDLLGPWEGKRLPYKELAKKLGRPLSTVKRWEQLGRISSRDAVRLAQLADCAVDWILTGRGQPPARLAIEGRLRDVRDAATVPQAPGTPSTAAPQRDAAGGSGRHAALPGPAARTASSQGGVAGSVADAITAVAKRAIERDELEHTDKRRRVLGEVLTDMGVILEKHGVRATELLDVAMILRKGKKPAKGSD